VTERITVTKSTHYPPVPVREFRQFMAIVRRLRRDCPWDRKQSHRSLRESLIEETYEVIDAIDQGHAGKLREELGDVLLHVAMQATIAEQRREFTLREVIKDIREKLIRRHPHVFGSTRLLSAKKVKRNWDVLKMQEGRSSVLDGVPLRLPALQRAMRVQQRAAKVGFDWKKKKEVWKKVREEVEELRGVLERAPARRREEEFGDLLFALVNYARFLGVDPESALRGTVEKFTRRFQHIERQLRKRGASVHTATLEEMDDLWNEAKRIRSRRRGSV
jgi:tetrapyrrole methylase family protein/MazG family protein